MRMSVLDQAGPSRQRLHLAAAILATGALISPGCGSAAVPGRVPPAVTASGPEPAASSAAPPDPAEAAPPMAPAFLAAVERAPEVQAAMATLRAAELRVRASGILPDPVLSVEGQRMRTEGTEGLEVWLEQEFPRWGERDAQRRMAEAEVAMAQAELDDSRGMAAAELAAAAAHGLPTVATRAALTETNTFVDGHNVLLCPPKDPAALAGAIQQLLLQPELRARLRHGVTQLAAEHFSWDKAVNALTLNFRK